MAVMDKLEKAFGEMLKPQYMRLENDDGISGYVVSEIFRRMSILDRQTLLDEAIRKANDPLSPGEQREILMIAALTPEEYDSVGAKIRIHRVNEFPDGTIEVMLHGGYSDANYVRSVLNKLEGVSTTEPEQRPGTIGSFLYFFAKGSEKAPLTKLAVIAALETDPYIQLVAEVGS